MESSKKIQQQQKTQQPQVGKTSSVAEQSSGISALRIEDIMMAIRFAERSNATELLKKAQMDLTGLKDNLTDQINSLKTVIDKL